MVKRRKHKIMKKKKMENQKGTKEVTKQSWWGEFTG
jgi:hypothetical protein